MLGAVTYDAVTYDAVANSTAANDAVADSAAANDAVADSAAANSTAANSAAANGAVAGSFWQRQHAPRIDVSPWVKGLEQIFDSRARYGAGRALSGRVTEQSSPAESTSTIEGGAHGGLTQSATGATIRRDKHDTAQPTARAASADETAQIEKCDNQIAHRI
jgi:hypothetical protein